MHTKTITINIFDIGDYARTPRGVGIVIDIEEFTISNVSRCEVMIQHKTGDEDNPTNRAQIFDNGVPILITKEEYDNEKC